MKEVFCVKTKGFKLQFSNRKDFERHIDSISNILEHVTAEVREVKSKQEWHGSFARN